MLQYAVKIRMKHTNSYSVGPYSNLDEARAMAQEIVSGNIDEVKTQRGSILFLCDDPEVVEIVRFSSRDEID